MYCGTVEPSDPLRYGRRSSHLPSQLLQFSEDKKPVVVWNVGRRCNLRCRHCYSASHDREYTGELTLDEGRSLLNDLAAYGVPVVLFSGGEPLLRADIFDLISHAVSLKLRAVVSTNGTLITEEIAQRLAAAGLSYVGISLDGLQKTNDLFRGVTGAFEAALAGVRNCRAAGVKVGLRFTMSRSNVTDVPGIFDLVRGESIPRICFYHLVYTGRAKGMPGEALDAGTARRTVDTILDQSRALHAEGSPVEVLTVDNHCDAPYLYMRLLREDPQRAAGVLKLLHMNGGNSSGRGIACVSWDGTVHPDQFWRHHACGNVREQPFSTIWGAPTDPLLSMLRSRRQHLTGRCATCRWLPICNGNLRVRAEAVNGDIWSPDPGCYLDDEEITGDVVLPEDQL